MATTVRLTVISGPHKGKRFCFCAPTQCVVGRMSNCLVQFSGTERDQQISRRHCQLNIDPPCIQVRDLGSTNGTYVNGRQITLVEPGLKEIAEWTGSNAIDHGLGHGDLVTVGGTTLRVDVVDCLAVAQGSEGKPSWEAGEVVKKDCSLDHCLPMENENRRDPGVPCPA